MSTIPSLDVKRLAVVSSHLPRRCGIATFCDDLAGAVEQELRGNGEVFALALDDTPQGYAYPDRVRFQIRANTQPDYRMAAEYIAASQADVVIIQHEYGLFGGPGGAHVLRLMRELRVPILTTLHTVLAEPCEEERRVMDELWRLSDRMIVMCRRAEAMLQSIHGVPAERIAFVPHGIPDVPFIDPNYFKDQFDAEGRRVVLTFGLLSPNKGIEYMIEAMPRVVDQFPDALYVVLGATHPNLKREEGEAYRTSLQRRVSDLALAGNVRFVNQFVELEELCQYIGAADVYVTPYLGEAQITSGTLAYALGAGKAVVSTPYWYAEEMLAEDRGLLVPFMDPDALAEAITRLFTKDTQRHQMRKRAYNYCRNMVWKQVAREYLLLAQTVLEERAHRPRIRTDHRKRVARIEELPELDLRHLRTMTDDVGILGHARLTTPLRRHGYCLEDNALASVLCGLHHRLYRSSELAAEASTYLAFLLDACEGAPAEVRDHMDYSRQWLDRPADEQGEAKVIWGLGLLATHGHTEKIRGTGAALFRQVISITEQFASARSWAFGLVGIHAYLDRYEGEVGVRKSREMLAAKLLASFKETSTAQWPWCESTLGNAGALLPQALMLAGEGLGEHEMIDSGLGSLTWLCEVQQSEKGHLSLVGDQGWYPMTKKKAAFNQRPVDAMHICLACCEAYRLTNDEQWLSRARLGLEWFLGGNDLETPLYDFTTGGCCDSLTPDGPNTNQGAEATLAWLVSLLTFLVQAGRQTLQIETDVTTASDPEGGDSVAVAGANTKQTAVQTEC